MTNIDIEALKSIVVSLVVAFIGSSTFFYVVFMFFKKTFKVLKEKLAKQEELGNISRDNYIKAVDIIDKSHRLLIDELVKLREENANLSFNIHMITERIEKQEAIFAKLIEDEIVNEK